VRPEAPIGNRRQDGILPQTAEQLGDVAGLKLRLRPETVTVLEGIMHVMEHFSGHAAQIIFITKFVTAKI
jgi:hypothetical protein